MHLYIEEQHKMLLLPLSYCRFYKTLKEKIQSAYFKAKGRYGSPRIKEELCRTGTEVSRPTVAKYMNMLLKRLQTH